MFDWEFRASGIVSGVSNATLPLRTVPGGGVVQGTSVDLSPTLSVLIPGIGFSAGCKETGQFRIGARVEFPLTPHLSDDTSSFWNLGQDGVQTSVGSAGQTVYWGAEICDWIIPEFIAEYWKGDFAFGLAYKAYNLEAQNGFVSGGDLQQSSTFGLADMNTLTIYAKYAGWLLGFNMIQDDMKSDSALAEIDHPFPVSLGYSVYF